MSVHIEGMGAAYAAAFIVPEGEEVVEDYEDTVVLPGNVALVFSADDVMILEGTPDEVSALIARINDEWATYLRVHASSGDPVIDRAWAAIREATAQYVREA